MDALRGMTIWGMIAVNSPGNEHAYPFLKHAAWNGWTAADLVFPSFLLIMGVSVALSLGRRVREKVPQADLLRQVVKRAAIMFALGLVQSACMYDAAKGFQVMGILQRIALCYLASSIIFLKTKPRAQALGAGAILLGYWLLLTQAPVPGFGKGVLTPEGNLAAYVDRLILGPITRAKYFEAESLLSTLPAVASSLFGVLAGWWLQRKKRMTVKAAGLLAAGAAAIAAGLLWDHSFFADFRWFPINKNLWTSSFALLAGGAALIGLAKAYWLVNVRKLIAWAQPFVMFGRNPLLAYCLSGLFYQLLKMKEMRLPDGSMGDLQLWLCAQLFGSWLSPANASLAFTLSYTALCLGLMTFLYRRKWFFSL